MPRDVFGTDFPFMKSSELLTFEEINRLTRLFAGLGVRKVRLTGGEPLLRHGIEQLVEQLAKIDGIDEVAMTTNGSLLAKKAATLRDAGLGRVTVSLDSLDPEIFRAMSDVKLSQGGTLAQGKQSVTDGGRVLSVSALGNTIADSTGQHNFRTYGIRVLCYGNDVTNLPGGSSIDTTVICRDTGVLACVPSVAETLTVRVPAVGCSLEFR